MSELESFLAEVQQEDASPFSEDTEKETPSESPTEANQEDDTSQTEADAPASSAGPAQVDVKPKPFHEDPAIQDYISRQVERRVAEKLPEIEQSISTKLSPQDTTIPSWFGGDAEQWHAYQAHQQSLIEKAKTEALREIEDKTRREQEQITKANSYIEEQISALQAEGKKFDRNELLKVVSDFRPVNESGNWDFRKAYDIYELKKAKDPEKSKARKAVAAATSSDTKAEPPQSTVKTYDEVKKMGWHSY